MTTFTKVTLIAAAAVAATLALLATAHADTTSRYQFVSPSGNIACQMDQRADGTADAWCKIQEHTWVEPESGDCEVGYLPGAIGEPAPELQLSQGDAPCLGFVMSQIFFSGPYAPATLDYGQSHTVGTITCHSGPSAVTCTDSSTDHFFRISRDSYQLG
jgi:hypothetical protein